MQSAKLLQEKPIGVLDSGIGGLSVLLEIKKLLPKESIIYIADSKNVPYSEKTDKEIFKLASKLVQFLVKKQCKLVVVACNTITVSAIDKLRKKFKNLPIVGTVPVVKTAAKLTKNKKFGVFSTKKTAESKYQKDLIEKFVKDCEVISIGSNGIAPMIERGEIGNKFNKILKNELSSFLSSNIDVLALGCTHYPLVKQRIQNILGYKTRIIDSGAAIARQVKKILRVNNSISTFQKPVYTFFTSGSEKVLNLWLKKLKLKGEGEHYG